MIAVGQRHVMRDAVQHEATYRCLGGTLEGKDSRPIATADKRKRAILDFLRIKIKELGQGQSRGADHPHLPSKACRL